MFNISDAAQAANQRCDSKYCRFDYKQMLYSNTLQEPFRFLV